MLLPRTVDATLMPSVWISRKALLVPAKVSAPSSSTSPRDICAPETVTVPLPVALVPAEKTSTSRPVVMASIVPPVPLEEVLKLEDNPSHWPEGTPGTEALVPLGSQ